jgi:hypothetical protein
MNMAMNANASFAVSNESAHVGSEPRIGSVSNDRLHFLLKLRLIPAREDKFADKISRPPGGFTQWDPESNEILGVNCSTLFQLAFQLSEGNNVFGCDGRAIEKLHRNKIIRYK